MRSTSRSRPRQLAHQPLHPGSGSRDPLLRRCRRLRLRCRAGHAAAALRWTQPLPGRRSWIDIDADLAMTHARFRPVMTASRRTSMPRARRLSRGADRQCARQLHSELARDGGFSRRHTGREDRLVRDLALAVSGVEPATGGQRVPFLCDQHFQRPPRRSAINCLAHLSSNGIEPPQHEGEPDQLCLWLAAQDRYALQPLRIGHCASFSLSERRDGLRAAPRGAVDVPSYHRRDVLGLVRSWAAKVSAAKKWPRNARCVAGEDVLW